MERFEKKFGEMCDMAGNILDVESARLRLEVKICNHSSTKRNYVRRYVRRSDQQRIAEWFDAGPYPADLPMPDADYNVASTTHQPIIRQGRQTRGRELILARWRLITFSTKDLKDVKGLTTINVRSETITTAPTWRGPSKKRRCLVPVSAF